MIDVRGLSTLSISMTISKCLFRTNVAQKLQFILLPPARLCLHLRDALNCKGCAQTAFLEGHDAEHWQECIAVGSLVVTGGAMRETDGSNVFSRRVAKGSIKGYSETQNKVRNATSNDPWGPSGTE